MTDPQHYAEEAAIEFANHPDLYLQDIDAAADDHQASKRRTTIIADDNPWE